MSFVLDDDFKRTSIGIALEILTERPCGLYASNKTRRNRFRHHDKHESCRNQATFAAFCRSDELVYYFRAIESLLWSSTAAADLCTSSLDGSAPCNSVVLAGETPEFKRLFDDWCANNQERIDERRTGIRDIVLLAFQVVWDMPTHLLLRRTEDRREQNAAIENAIYDHFNEVDAVVDAWEENKLLFDAVLGKRQICTIYNVIQTVKSPGNNNDIGDRLNRSRILCDTETAYRFEIVRGRYRSIPPCQAAAAAIVSQQHQVLVEVGQLQGQQRSSSSTHQGRDKLSAQSVTKALQEIASATSVSAVCNVLRDNLQHSAICKAALSRLDYIKLLGEYSVPQEWLVVMVATDAMELVLKSMVGHLSKGRNNSNNSSSSAIHDRGLDLLRATCAEASSATKLTARLQTCPGIETSLCIVLASVVVVQEKGLQKWGLETLLAVEKQNRSKDNNNHSLDSFYGNAIKANVLVWMKTLLECHSNDFAIVKHALTILGNVLGGDNDASNNEAICANRQAICSHMRTHAAAGIGDFCKECSDFVSVLKAVYVAQKGCDKERAKQTIAPLARRVYALFKHVPVALATA